jgi:glycerophosphoryl diester phosphodiesterase
MIKRIFILLFFTFFIAGCSTQKEISESNKNSKMLSEKSVKIRNYLKKDIVIAHRGSTYWTPEETEPAFRWARNIGADYLEFDIQMTKDSVLVALHDNTLLRTSNVKEIYPNISKPNTLDFTLKQLRELDFGSWFNEKYPERARKDYAGQIILTLKDVIMIAEGYRIIRVNGEPAKEVINNNWTGNYLFEKDPQDNLNRPGIYVETKKNHLEELLFKELKKAGWLIADHPKRLKTYKGKVATGNSNARVVLQSFHKKSIEEFNVYLPGIPKCLLVNSIQALGLPKSFYPKTIEFCVRNDVEILGPDISGKDKSNGLTAPWMAELVHSSGMIVHSYTFNTKPEFEKYAPLVDGVFTNRADLALIYYKRLKINIAEDVLKELGY